MSEWKDAILEDLVTLQRGHDLPKTAMSGSGYLVAGSNGIIGYHNNFTTHGPGFTIGRSGSIGTPHYYDSDYWAHNTVLFVKDFHGNFPRFAYYFFKNLDFSQYNVGSAVPTLNRNHIHGIPILLPPLPEQRAIAEVLSSLDDKIDLLHRNNKTLEQMAETLFRQWFIVEAKEDWSVESFGNFVTVKRGGSPRPIQEFLSDSGLRWLKISDVSNVDSPFIFEIKEHIKEHGINKTILLKAGSLVVSNSATPGIPKILAVDSCIHDGWLYFPESKFSNEFLYLFFLKIKTELVALGNGSIFTNLKTDIVKSFPITVPDDVTLSRFDSAIKPLFNKMYSNTVQLRKLIEIRDSLLPKLMSGQVRVKTN